MIRQLRRLVGKRKTFRSFALQALGEITLIVIGILLALQFNNWNERRQDANRADEYRTSIIQDLETDSTEFDLYFSIWESSLTKLGRFQDRLSDSSATTDTLIQISQFEFEPSTLSVPEFHNATFQDIRLSGDLQLLAPWLRKALIDLDKKQRHTKRVQASMDDLYLPNRRSYGSQYSLSDQFVTEGPLADKMWPSVDLSDAAVSFNNLITLKYQKLQFQYGSLKVVAGQTNMILKRLRRMDEEG